VAAASLDPADDVRRIFHGLHPFRPITPDFLFMFTSWHAIPGSRWCVCDGVRAADL